MDLPWNPAVLEQRIARIYRIGQQRNIQVVNLVSADSFEEAMLGKLRFKASLFAGVLDNGQDSIFVSDSKFNELMKDIQSTMDDSDNSNTLMVTTDEMEPTANAPAETFTTIDDDHDSEGDILLDENDQSSDNREQVGEKLGTASSVASLHHQEGEDDTQTYKKGTNSGTHSQPSPKELVAEGVSFLTGLSKTLESPEATRELVNSLVEVDQETGQTNLRIPVPDKESVVQVLSVLGKLFTR